MNSIPSKGVKKALRRLRVPRYKREIDPTTLIPPSEWTILRGDLVMMMSGEEEGKRGIVKKVIRKQNKLLVEGFNVRQRNIIDKDGYTERSVTSSSPVPVSEVSVVCPKTDRPTGIIHRYLETGQRVRVAEVSGAIVERPDILKQRKKPKSLVAGPKDTQQVHAHEITFKGLDENGDEIR